MDTIESFKKGLKVYNSFEEFVTEAESCGYEFSDVEEAEQLWLHSERNALLNLPTCQSCSHWPLEDNLRWGYCDSKNYKSIHKSYMCNDHSKIEQLRKDNDN